MMKRLAALLVLALAGIAHAQAPIGGSELRIQETGGSQRLTIGPIPSLSANRSCVPEDDSTPLDPCVTGGGSGDVTDVWGCASGNCSALTAASGDSLDAGSADTTNPCKEGTAAPGTCAVGECFFDTDATAGANIQLCTATNTWTAISGSGGSGKPWEKFTANQAFLPTVNYATQDTRNTHPVLDFDDSTDECAYFGGVMNTSYAGGGLNVMIAWMATSATTGAAGWCVAFESHPDDALDLDADSFATAKCSSDTTASVSGEVQYTTIAFSNAEIDSLTTGDSYRLRPCRDGDGSTVTDSMTGDAELYKVVVREP